jgi:hypothetical protein
MNAENALLNGEFLAPTVTAPSRSVRDSERPRMGTVSAPYSAAALQERLTVTRATVSLGDGRASEVSNSRTTSPARQRGVRDTQRSRRRPARSA